MENCSKIQKALLENQSQELFCCLTQSIGWMKAMSGLLSLSAFPHTRCPVFETCERCSMSKLSPFSIQLFTNKFRTFLDHIRDSLAYLINHPSAVCLPEKDSGSPVDLLHLMEEITEVLLDKDLTDDCVAAAFGLTSATDVIATDEKRIGCITVLDELIKSLKLPQLKDRDEIDGFCIEHSRIIITTVDGTNKLHGLDMDTFDILLISDAGRIKECNLLVPLLLLYGTLYSLATIFIYNL
jgi:senataxin